MHSPLTRSVLAVPDPARRVNPSWCFPQFSNGLFTKLMISNYASYNCLLALKRPVLSLKSLVTRVFIEFIPVFPENSLAQGLQRQVSVLGTERVNLVCWLS